MSNTARLLADAKAHRARASQKTNPAEPGPAERGENTLASDVNKFDSTEPAEACTEFLKDVLPEVPGANYCLWTKRDKRHHWFGTLDDTLAAISGQFINVPDTYFGTAAFGGAISPKTGSVARAQTNIIGKLALYADLDCGAEKFAKKPSETYPTQDDALRDAVRIVKAGQLPAPTYIINSGTGVHLYWCLERAIDSTQWDVLAGGLAHSGAHAGLKFDRACTEDSARLLRPIGALHRCGNRVTILKKTGRKYTPDQLAKQFGIAVVPGFSQETDPAMFEMVKGDVTPAYDNTPGDFEQIQGECEAMRWAADPVNQPEVNRNLWLNGLSIATRCEGGHFISPPDHLRGYRERHGVSGG